MCMGEGQGWDRVLPVRAVRGRRQTGAVIATKGGFVFRERPAAEQSVRRHAKAVVTSAREAEGCRLGRVPSPSGSYASAGLLATAPPQRRPGQLAPAPDGPDRRLPAP